MSSTLVAKLADNPVGTSRELADEALQAVREQHDRWQRWERKYRNRWYLNEALFWDNNPRRPRMLQYSCNYIFATVETLIGYMREYPPRAQIQGTEEDDRLIVPLLQRVFDLELEYSEDNIWDAQRKAIMFDTGFLRSDYDAATQRVIISSVSPFEILPDPKAGSWDEMSYVIHRRYGIPTEWVSARYGVEIRPSDEKNPKMSDRKAQTGSAVPKCDIDEVWVWDASAERWIRTLIAGSTVLEPPHENPYRHGELPIVPLYDVEPEFGVWGIGEVEMIEPLQDLADALDHQIYRIIKKTANRIRFVGSGAGISASQITDEPTNYDVIDPTRIKWEDAPDFPGELMAYRAQVERYIQILTGIYDVTVGQTPQRVTAASAISILQDAAIRRIAAKQANLQRALKRVFRQFLHNMLQFYSVPTWQRILGKGVKVIGGYPEGIELPEDKQRFRDSAGVTLVLSEIEPRYDVVVTTDSALPASRAQRARLYLELWDKRLVDREAVLEALDIPDRDAILARMREQEAVSQEPRKEFPADRYPNLAGGFNPLEAMMMTSPAQAGGPEASPVGLLTPVGTPTGSPGGRQ